MSRRPQLAIVPQSTLPVARPKALADMVPLFLRWFQFERLRAPNTIAGYGFDLRIFLEFAQKAKLDLADDVRFQHIEFYLGDLRAERGSAVATANRHLHTLRAFWRYLVREGLATGNPPRTCSCCRRSTGSRNTCPSRSRSSSWPCSRPSKGSRRSGTWRSR